MHEFSIVEALVQRILSEVRKQGDPRVDSIHFRRGSAFSEPALVQAFEVLARDTPLEKARLVIEILNRDFTCPRCGHSQVVQSDDLIGHMFVCPGCGYVEEIDEAHDLELLSVRVA